MDTTRVPDPLIPALLNVIPDSVVLLDPSGRIVIANHKLADYLNMAVEELIDTNIFDMLPPSVARERRERLRAVSATGQPTHFEDQHEGRWIEHSLYPVPDATGKVLRVVCFSRDVTERKRAEEASRNILLENEQRYRELADSITDLFSALDSTLTYTYWNKACERLTGVSANNAIGRKPGDIFLGEATNTMATEVFRDVLRTRAPRTFVNSTRINGAELVFEVSVYPSASGISVFAHDITARRRRDEALRQSEQRFRSLYENAALGMKLVGVDGCLLGANPFFCRMLGYSEGELLNRSWEEITHPDDVAPETARIRALLRGQYASYEHEKRYVRRDGSLIWAGETASCVRDDAGQPLYRVVVVQDVTMRKKAEAALRVEEERFRATFEQAAVGMAHVALDGRFLMANDRLCEMLACSQQELLAKRLHEITDGKEGEHSLRNARLLSGEIRKYTIEKLYTREGGRILWIYFTISLVRDRTSGEPRYYVAAAENITARKEAEQALLDLGGRLIDAQEEERRRVARELHDGVGQALGMLGIEVGKAAGKAVIPYVRESLDKVSVNIRQIARDLHGISHRLHPSTLDHLGLSLAIKEHCDVLSALHPQLQITFEAGNVPCAIPSDVALCMFRIVQEALGNIVRHSGAHKAQVTLGTHGHDIILSVEDDGCGFDVERALVEGGLGLVSMRERLRLVGGSMSIGSRPCAGTRLEARAPVGERRNEAAA